MGKFSADPTVKLSMTVKRLLARSAESPIRSSLVEIMSATVLRVLASQLRGGTPNRVLAWREPTVGAEEITFSTLTSASRYEGTL